MTRELFRFPDKEGSVGAFERSSGSVASSEIILTIICCVQVETIGDAYCVAGGLHKESETHAVQIALMALKMMELSDEVTTPTGEQIQVRVKY